MALGRDEQNEKTVQCAASKVVGHTDSNRGPKDYEFANDTAALGFIGLHEKTVQYAKAQRSQYVSER